jgi:SAM-dependent methyltransferase
MPDLDENAAYWDGGFHWRYGGDEWSAWWGGPEPEWRVTIEPRIAEYLPVRRLLEIAPGYGRWTQFLRAHCDELIGIDLSAQCVDACRDRFSEDESVSFHVNDGKSLSAVDSGAVDFAFSFDSLVHVEQDVMDAYVNELARVLTDDGVAFLHHSNMGAFPPEQVGKRIPHWRSGSVSADSVAESAGRAGLNCFRQELIGWGEDHDYLSDSFTWVARAGSTHDRPREVVENTAFMEEAKRASGQQAAPS